MEPRDRGRSTVAVVSGFAMLAVLVAVAMVGSLLRGAPTGADTTDGPSASAEPVPSVSTGPAPSGSPAPTARPTSPWRLLRVGEPVTTATEFTDPGTNDTHTCDIDWDDGTRISGPAPGHVCRGTHTYTRAGMYTIRSVITDDDGGALKVPGVLVVVYDPAGGAARGTGRLKAGDGFDFTAGYPARSATEPDGQVTVALPARLNLDLRNHQHLDWLVVTPDGKLAVKGTAERDPGHRVGFLLYGYYGCPAGQTKGCQPGPHRLRLVVWDATATPDGVPALYDNRPGGSFDLDQADPPAIDQGSILVPGAR